MSDNDMAQQFVEQFLISEGLAADPFDDSASGSLLDPATVQFVDNSLTGADVSGRPLLEPARAQLVEHSLTSQAALVCALYRPPPSPLLNGEWLKA